MRCAQISGLNDAKISKFISPNPKSELSREGILALSSEFLVGLLEFF